MASATAAGQPRTAHASPAILMQGAKQAMVKL